MNYQPTIFAQGLKVPPPSRRLESMPYRPRQLPALFSEDGFNTKARSGKGFNVWRGQ
jgi:hypothetical protein